MGGGKRDDGGGGGCRFPYMPKDKFIKVVSNSVTVHLNNLNHTRVRDVGDMYLQSTF